MIHSTRPHPHRQESFPGISAAQLLMYVGLGSLTMLFGGSLVAYFITRAQATTWRSADLPALPWGLWLSSATLLVLSLVLHLAMRHLRRNALEALSRMLLLALCMACGFLIVQAYNWRSVLLTALATEQKSLYVYTFFMLTVLHAVHVLAGIVPLGIVYSRSLGQHYSSSQSEGVRLLRQYWDFLLVVWVVLLVSLGLF